MPDDEIPQDITALVEPSKIIQFSRDVAQLFAARRENEATEMMVQHLKNTHRFLTIKAEEDSRTWIYRDQDGCFTQQAIVETDAFVRQVMGPAYKNKYLTAVMDRIKADTYIDEDEFEQKNPSLLCVRNVVIDTLSGQSTQHSPDFLFRNKIDVKHIPDAECPNFLGFLNEIMHEEDIPALQEFFGYTLYRAYPYQKALMLLGGGSNGKSTLLRILRWFLGPENTSSLTFEQVCDQNGFEASELKGKYACLMSEVTGGYLAVTEGFKELTGNDAVNRKRKNLSTANFVNFSKFILSLNKLPRFADQSDANFRRWMVIEFPYKFVTKKEYDLTPLDERANLRHANEEHIARIFTEEEKSGILNWTLAGLQRLFKNNEFSYGKTTAQVRELIVKKGDPYTYFCDQAIIEQDGAELRKSDLERTYTIWAVREGIDRKYDGKKIKSCIMRKYGQLVDDRVTKDSEGNSYRFFSGVVLKEEWNTADTADTRFLNHPVKDISLASFQNSVFPVTAVENSQKTTPVTADTGISSSSSILQKSISVRNDVDEVQIGFTPVDIACAWIVARGNEVDEFDFVEAFNADILERLKRNGDVYERRAGRISVIAPDNFIVPKSGAA